MDGASVIHHGSYAMGPTWGGRRDPRPASVTIYPVPATVIVLARWPAPAGGFMISVESRRHAIILDDHPQVVATVCAEASHLLDCVATIAQRIAAGPQPLRVVVSNDVDKGLGVRVMLVLAAVRAGADDDQRVAA